MQFVVDKPLLGLLLDHRFEPHEYFEKIDAFLIIASPVDTLPELRLVHTSRIHVLYGMC